MTISLRQILNLLCLLPLIYGGEYEEQRNQNHHQQQQQYHQEKQKQQQQYLCDTIKFYSRGNGGRSGGSTGEEKYPKDEHHLEHIQKLIKTSPVILKALGARIFADYNQDELQEARKQSRDNVAAASYDEEKYQRKEATLITLTPETIYKGASILKVPQIADVGEYYQYKGQLNATIGTLGCFDSSILNLLPTQLIVFGKIENSHPDLLTINTYGLHKWSQQFESSIWKYLGWDDWSDFTLCSVTCGKGVQQRFRRCLLDSIPPKTTTKTETQRIDDSTEKSYISVNENIFKEDEIIEAQKIDVEKNSENLRIDELMSIEQRKIKNNNNNNSGSNNSSNNRRDNKKYSNLIEVERTETRTATVSGTAQKSNSSKMKKRKKKKFKGLSTLSCEGYNIEQRNCNMFECRDDISDLLKFYKKNYMYSEYVVSGNNPNGNSAGNTNAAGGDEKEDVSMVPVLPTTTSRTISIVSRPSLERSHSSSSTPSLYSNFSSNLSQDNITNEDVKGGKSSSSVRFGQEGGGGYGGYGGYNTDSGDELATGIGTITVSPNGGGFVREWRSPMNFTIMTTLRAKIRSQSMVFSLRNLTHNFYLENCQEGLKLYQERNDVTEMLPIKFDLYDNRWHQISISVHNGDFLSIYVDCSWLNSFVVSKGFFVLPNNADVEVGRGFSGELQQLLIIPGNNEKLQCSNFRTSINEVKRYIIDTFIDEDSK